MSSPCCLHLSNILKLRSHPAWWMKVKSVRINIQQSTRKHSHSHRHRYGYFLVSFCTSDPHLCCWFFFWALSAADLWSMLNGMWSLFLVVCPLPLQQSFLIIINCVQNSKPKPSSWHSATTIVIGGEFSTHMYT